MRDATFNLFVYGTLKQGGRGTGVLEGCEHLGTATLHGLLYDIDGQFPALLMYGEAEVHGELWRCPGPLLLRLDAYEGVETGLFRRVGVEPVTGLGERVPAWAYVAGPALSRKLTPSSRMEGSAWPPVQ